MTWFHSVCDPHEQTSQVEGQRNFDFVAAYLASFAHMLPGKKEVEAHLNPAWHVVSIYQFLNSKWYIFYTVQQETVSCIHPASLFAHTLWSLEVVLTLLSAEYNLNPHFRDDWEHEASTLGFWLFTIKITAALAEFPPFKNDMPTDWTNPDLYISVLWVGYSPAGLGKGRRWTPAHPCPILHDEIPTEPRS